MIQHLRGRLDGITNGSLDGWAIGLMDEQECESLDIEIDGVLVGTTKAGLYREDLAEAGIRGGHAKFRYRVPPKFFDGKLHQINVRHAGSLVPLENSPIDFRSPKNAAASAHDRRDWALKTLVLKDETRGRNFRLAVRTLRRLALFSTFHNSTSFMLYHRAVCSALVEAGFVVVIIHASSGLDERLNTSLGSLCYTIVKRNVGYDFGSWAVGSFVVGKLMDSVDELLLLNDSFVELEAGTLGRLIMQSRALEMDMVGVTDSYERCYHLQSYFLWFGSRICRSSMLRLFLSSYSFSSYKETVIEEGELAITQRVMDAGFRVTSLFSYERLASLWMVNLDGVFREIRSLPILPGREGGGNYKIKLLDRLDGVIDLIIGGRPTNPSHFFWDTLIEDLDCKLLKREFAFVNPCHVPTHFRLGKLLSRLPDAKMPLADLRRRYGGDLIPAFSGVPEVELASAQQLQISGREKRRSPASSRMA